MFLVTRLRPRLTCSSHCILLTSVSPSPTSPTLTLPTSPPRRPTPPPYPVRNPRHSETGAAATERLVVFVCRRRRGRARQPPPPALHAGSAGTRPPPAGLEDLPIQFEYNPATRVVKLRYTPFNAYQQGFDLSNSPIIAALKGDVTTVAGRERSYMCTEIRKATTAFPDLALALTTKLGSSLEHVFAADSTVSLLDEVVETVSKINERKALRNEKPLCMTWTGKKSEAYIKTVKTPSGVRQISNPGFFNSLGSVVICAFYFTAPSDLFANKEPGARARAPTRATTVSYNARHIISLNNLRLT